MEKRDRNNAIAVFDSGVGGISVLRELVKVLPNENFIYYGDSKNAPYGTKTLEEVRRLTCAHVEELFEEGAKGLVVACNTATSAAVRLLRERYPEIPIVGIEPAIKPAVEAGENQQILVMATPMTIHEEKLKHLMAQYEDRAVFYPLPCPGLMDFVERGDLNSPALMKYLEELLYSYKNRRLDSAVLGCTHYPFVREAIAAVLGGNVALYDGGAGTAREMRRRLTEAKLLNPSEAAGTVDFRNSLPDSEEKLRLCRELLKA